MEGAVVWLEGHQAQPQQERWQAVLQQDNDGQHRASVWPGGHVVEYRHRRAWQCLQELTALQAVCSCLAAAAPPVPTAVLRSLHEHKKTFYSISQARYVCATLWAESGTGTGTGVWSCWAAAPPLAPTAVL